ncbi:MAG: hypothetical protein JW757_06610 [Anaerolineales bacterium]|nr:hypothetical protein [Anaerolineales bacterium]
MKRIILIWIILAVLVFALTFSRAKSDAVYCWDGLEVDEPLLQELCGISEEQYLSGDYDPDACPDAYQAVRMIGGCETDWSMVSNITAMVMTGFLMISALFFFARWLVKRWSQ